MIPVPRALFLSLGALFSAYHLFLAFYSLDEVRHVAPTLVAMGLYALATVLSLWPWSPPRMPGWLASFDLAVCIAMPILVSSQLPDDQNVLFQHGYVTWYVAAVGTLMVVAAMRRSRLVAWAGVLFLAVHTIAWLGPGALGPLGVIGSVVWVGVATVIMHALAKAVRDARQFARAEREAAEWQAAQDAHVSERQFRLRQTYRVAAPMLAWIARSKGDLKPHEQQECRYLEGALRDEIRGRRLLNDDVRAEVKAARRRGIVVNLMDEGGLDELDDDALTVVLARLAEAIRTVQTDKLIVRTVPGGSGTAVTVVGLRMQDDSANALGVDSDEDEVDLWLAIPREAAREEAREGAREDR